MIRSFRHKGVERFFKSGSHAEIQVAHAPRLARQLSALDAATRPEDMNRPGWDWHPLKGSLSGHWSVSVNGNWRLIFAFEHPACLGSAGGRSSCPVGRGPHHFV
ncbi:MAG: peptidase [Betaproteobacteria bacterium]|nr:peptidase [Betaproteobacteria bacterium]